MKLKSGETGRSAASTQTTVIDSLLVSDLPEAEKSFTRLQQEAMGMVGAGIETTRATLTLATYYLLDNPNYLQRLGKEVKLSLPGAHDVPALSELERLPFLTAIIQECKLHASTVSEPLLIASQPFA